MRTRSGVLAVLSAAAALLAALLATACSSATAAGNTGRTDSIQAIGAENQYADVIAQVGGKYVPASAIMSNPNTDPHTFEAARRSPREVGQRQLVVQNGVGYDALCHASRPRRRASGRTVIDVQQLLGLPDTTPNPHLWYDPTTMPKVADAIAADLAAIQPAHAAYFKANAATFTASLSRLEPGDRSLQGRVPGHPGRDHRAGRRLHAAAAGADNLTPWTFQADIMNGIDPSPQNVAAQKALFTEHKVKVFLYNQQVTDTLTESFIKLAHAQPHPGRRRVRDHADSRLRLPDLDAGRGARPAQGGDRQGFNGAPVTGNDLLRLDDIGVRLGGRQVLSDVSFSLAPASSPASSARTARARPRCSASSSACRRRPTAGCS